MRLTLGTLGYGASALGNLYRPVDDDAASEVVGRMWDGGVRYFDTAPHYGLGLSERRLGRALAGRPREDYVISTKVGRVLEPNPGGIGTLDDEGFAVEATLRRRWDFSAAGVRRSLEQSLERIGTDRVDLVLLHDPEGHLDQAIAEAVPALVELRDQGQVTAIGVGSKDVGALRRLIETDLIDVAMVAGRYTLLEQPAAAGVLPAALAHAVDVIAVGVYNSGVLAKPVPDASLRYEYGDVPPAVLDRAIRIAEICRTFDVDLPHAALQFPLRHPAIVNVTVGMGRPRHVGPTLEYARTAIPDALWVELEGENLIPKVAA
ncbi:aldo/keto reductase [Agromyces silvae]|uniref:aldo/keto reductase n=1 Tax=Agromyces silvae TaxID=3388266 RepID=UPI00280B331D|nr:aldo/keto reductase [Agromyces protaetiae]